jgi:hypothetical protein
MLVEEVKLLRQLELVDYTEEKLIRLMLLAVAKRFLFLIVKTLYCCRK